MDTQGWELLMSHLDNISSDGKNYPYAQSIAAFTAKENLYSAVVLNPLDAEHKEESKFINTLENAGDTEVLRILCRWHNGCLDLPSFAFRSMLIAANPLNQNTKLLLQCADGMCEKTISVTMPGKP